MQAEAVRKDCKLEVRVAEARNLSGELTRKLALHSYPPNR